MAAPYKWYDPSAGAGGNGDSYATAYNDINTAFAALSATYYILNIVPTLTGVIPTVPIVLSGLKGAPTTFMPTIRITNAAGDPLSMTDRFILDGNATLLNVLQIIDCAYVEFVGLTFDRATEDNVQGLTTVSTHLTFTDCDSKRAGRHGLHSFIQSSSIWRFNRGNYSNNVNRGITYSGTLNSMNLHALDIRNNGGDYQVAIPSASCMSDCIIANGARGLLCAATNYIIGSLFDNFSVNAITASATSSTILNLLIKNSPIGIIGIASNYNLDNITYYNVPTPRTTTTGKPRIGRETILAYDPTDANLNQIAKVPTRRNIIPRNGFLYGETAGVSGSDVIYPSILSVVPNILPTTGGTIVITYADTDSAAGLTAGAVTLGSVAASSISIVSGTVVNATFGALTSGQKDLVTISTAGTATRYGAVTVQAGATAPGAIVVSAANTAFRKILIRWQGGSGFSTIKLYRGVTLLLTTSTVNEYEDTVELDTSYTYRVLAENDTGSSEDSYTIKSWAVFDVPEKTAIGDLAIAIRDAVLEIKDSGVAVFSSDNVQIGRIFDLDNRFENGGFPCVAIEPGERGATGGEYDSQREITGDITFGIWLHVKTSTDNRKSGQDMIDVSRIGSAVLRMMYSFLDRKTATYPCNGYVFTNAQFSDIPMYEIFRDGVNTTAIAVSFRVDTEDTEL